MRRNEPPSSPSAPSLMACAIEIIEFSGHCSDAPLKRGEWARCGVGTGSHWVECIFSFPHAARAKGNESFALPMPDTERQSVESGGGKGENLLARHGGQTDR